MRCPRGGQEFEIGQDYCPTQNQANDRNLRDSVHDCLVCIMGFDGVLAGALSRRSQNPA